MQLFQQASNFEATHITIEGLEPRKLMAADLFVQAGQSIQNAINQASGGDVIHVSSGVYKENLSFSRSGVTLVASDSDVFVEGYVTGTAPDITVDGITVRNVRNGLQNENAAIRTNSGWTLKNVTSEYNTGTGIGVFGDQVTLVNPVAAYNGQNGIGGANASNVDIYGGEIYKNNSGVIDPPWKNNPNARLVNGLWYSDPAWEGGGGKWFNTTNVQIQWMKVYNNVGPGIWFDSYNRDSTIVDNEIFGNVGLTADWQGMGVSVEINNGRTNVLNNYIHDDSGAGIAVQESRNTLIKQNHLVNDGLELRALGNRPVSLFDVRIVQNVLDDASPYVSSGSAAGSEVRWVDNFFSNVQAMGAAQSLGDFSGHILG
jgi:Right handed beta helix region